MMNLMISNDSSIYKVIFNDPINADQLHLDFDCDGQEDLLFQITSSDYYVDGYHISQSNFKVKPMNLNVFILGDTTVDSTFYQFNSDTTDMFINQSSFTTSYFINGSTLESQNTNTYITNVDPQGIIYANDSRWSNSLLTALYHYKQTYSLDFSDGLYSYYVTTLTETMRGVIPNYSESLIPFKYITNSGKIKLGYIKLTTNVYFGSISVMVSEWAIQR